MDARTHLRLEIRNVGSVTVHVFRDTADAYNASQTHGDIHDGDVLYAKDERVVGIMVSAWPTAVSWVPRIGPGAFHELKDDLTWTTFDGGKYGASFAACLEVISDEG